MASLILALTPIAFGAAGETPIQIEIIGEFASFTNRAHPDNRIGYRFHEHTPLVYGTVPRADTDGTATAAERVLTAFEKRPGVKVFRRQVTEEGWIPQEWTFYLAPAVDGIDIVLVVKTQDAGLPEFYGVQQCFRLSGATNEAWRQKYARTPAFSEFDAWKAAPTGATLPSLTWVLRDGALVQLPAEKETVGCRTAYGLKLDTERSGGHIETLDRVGAYNARMLWTADDGLILRTSGEGTWSTGLYWERTTHVTDHHPADCLHEIVNIGGVLPHSQRAIRGKIYWMRGGGDELVAHYRKDFGEKRRTSE